MVSRNSNTDKWLTLAVLAIAVAGVDGKSLVGMVSHSITSRVQEQEDSIDIDSLMQEGRAKIGEGEYAEAAEIFRKVIAADENVALAWQLLGYALHVDGKLDEAIEAHTKASMFPSVEGIALYNLACAWSLKNDADKAIGFFEQAVEAGYNDTDIIDNDSDLNNIRSDSRFKSLVTWARTGKRPAGEDNDLVGNWKTAAGERAGEKIEVERLGGEVEFTDKQILIPVPGADAGFVMNYSIDKTKTPMEIDMEIESGPAPEGTAIGIIKVADGKLTLCYDPTGATRPEEFATTAENGFFLFECTKAEPSFNVAAIKGTWVIDSGIRAGAEVGKDRLAGTVKIDEEKITMPAGDDEFVMSYTIDPSTSPVAIDMKILSGPAPEGSPAFGIIKMDGKNIVLCYNALGEDRPTDFESTSENNFFLFTLGPAK